MEFAGEFETHLTVCLDRLESIERLKQWGREYHLKCLHIILDRGVTPSQPMLTRCGKGELTTELKIAWDLSTALNAEEFTVTRIKIEAAPWNQDVPLSNLAALAHPIERYFEHHIKLSIAPNIDISRLTAVAELHSAHLSRNALHICNDDFQVRFVTQRCAAVGRIEARRQLQMLLDDITNLGYLWLDVEEEFVVYDSNLAIDRDWIRSK